MRSPTPCSTSRPSAASKGSSATSSWPSAWRAPRRAGNRAGRSLLLPGNARVDETVGVRDERSRGAALAEQLSARIGPFDQEQEPVAELVGRRGTHRFRHRDEALAQLALVRLGDLARRMIA